MQRRLVDVQSVSSFQGLITNVTSIKKNSREVDCLQVIPDLGWELCSECVAQSTLVLLDSVVTDHVLTEVLHAQVGEVRTFSFHRIVPGVHSNQGPIRPILLGRCV